MEVYREEDDRIGWRVAGSNECGIYRLLGNVEDLEDSERSLQTADATWQAVLVLSGSYLTVDF